MGLWLPFPPAHVRAAGLAVKEELWPAPAVLASCKNSVTLSFFRVQCCLTLPSAELPAVCARALPLPFVHPGQGWSPSEHQRLPQSSLGWHHGMGTMRVLAGLGQGGGSPFPAGDPVVPEALALSR